MNNPNRYTDPSGHRNCEEDGYDCEKKSLKIQRSTVTINAYEGDNLYLGLGTVVTNQHTIVTAAHVLPENIFTGDEKIVIGQDVVHAAEYTISELTLEYSEDEDTLTITLPNDLTGNVLPATLAPDYSPNPGDYVSIPTQNTLEPYVVTQNMITSPATNPYTGIAGKRYLEAITTNINGAIKGGDSGGGVFFNGHIIGVVSAGDNNSVWFSPYP